MRCILLIFFLFAFYSCQSTAKYRAIKNSRQNQSQNRSQNQSYSRSNTQIQSYIHDWIGVPYKYGGMTKRGIDCSGFTSLVYKEVYNFKLPRTALDQYNSGKKIRINQLNEGDLVFFRGVRGPGIDHVGLYL